MCTCVCAFVWRSSAATLPQDNCCSKQLIDSCCGCSTVEERNGGQPTSNDDDVDRGFSSPTTCSQAPEGHKRLEYNSKNAVKFTLHRKRSKCLCLCVCAACDNCQLAILRYTHIHVHVIGLQAYRE